MCMLFSRVLRYTPRFLPRAVLVSPLVLLGWLVWAWGFYRQSRDSQSIKRYGHSPCKTSILPTGRPLLSALRAKLRHAWFIADRIWNCMYDCRRFLKWSGGGGRLNTQTKLAAAITIDYHCIEKGLALRQPRPEFGRDVVERLLTRLREYHFSYGLDQTGQVALNVLFAYHYFNLENGIDDGILDQELRSLKDRISVRDEFVRAGGVVTQTREAIWSTARCDLRPFFESRHSIRHFAPDKVDMSLITEAVSMSQRTPSVCNRQSCRVYVFSSDEDKKQALRYQSGNRGFGEDASKILVLTSELGNFLSVGERNECWIDGGMYAMSLVYALHSLGLGACCLNWCVRRQVDREFKRVMGFSDSESIVMMIAVGHLPSHLAVPASHRKSLAEVLVIR